MLVTVLIVMGTMMGHAADGPRLMGVHMMAAGVHHGRLVQLVLVMVLHLMDHRLDVLDRLQHGLHDRCAVVVGAALVRRGHRDVVDDVADMSVLRLLVVVDDDMLLRQLNDVLLLVLVGMAAAVPTARRRSGGGDGNEG